MMTIAHLQYPKAGVAEPTAGLVVEPDRRPALGRVYPRSHLGSVPRADHAVERLLVYLLC